MDKTTTWLVRGAAIVVIIVGWVSYLEPYLKKQELIRLNRNYENQKSKSVERCDQKKRISYSELLDLINSGQVKSIMLSPDTSLVEIKTKNNSFVASIAPDKDLLALFSANNIQMVVGSEGLCK